MMTIIDSGGKNVASIQFAFERIGVRALLSSDPAVIKQSERLILPGVGHAKYAMNFIQEKGLLETIQALTQPVLGICVGMQLLFSRSQEGEVDMLNKIKEEVVSMSALMKELKLAIPHMGWNRIEILKDNPLLIDIPQTFYGYFAHSYFVPIQLPETLAMTSYGMPFSAIVQHKNFYGVQFHPEKSGRDGQKLLQNFMRI